VFTEGTSPIPLEQWNSDFKLGLFTRKHIYLLRYGEVQVVTSVLRAFNAAARDPVGHFAVRFAVDATSQ
jgi:hypothetical protein